ncbi:MAG: Uma2 family endonuclease [Xenococcaceae cyanobacterium MO_167.B27]|nr:Uma2 family endonuclease [Xenococcaceae cyanobacterium MO_167.B27]
MYAVISPEKIEIPPGAVFQIPGSWDDYETLSQQLGDRSIPRLKYRLGEIWLMSPLPEHGRNVHIIATVVTTILDHLGKEYEAFTPVTMKLPQRSGIEPDYCFYIDNWQAASGKKRINWETEPAPDLIIEVDITSYTDVNDYLVYKVPEVWLFKNDVVTIYRLEGDRYTVNNSSRYFPDIEVLNLISDCFKVAETRNTSTAIRQLRQKL